MAAGFWQLDRAAEKRALFQAFARGDAAPAAERLPGDGAAPGQRYAPLQLTGRYLPDRQVLLDNMSLGGRPGYQVLTPLQTDDGVVMVNRGWGPADGDRARRVRRPRPVRGLPGGPPRRLPLLPHDARDRRGPDNRISQSMESS